MESKETDDSECVGHRRSVNVGCIEPCLSNCSPLLQSSSVDVAEAMKRRTKETPSSSSSSSVDCCHSKVRPFSDESLHSTKLKSNESTKNPKISLTSIASSSSSSSSSSISCSSTHHHQQQQRTVSPHLHQHPISSDSHHSTTEDDPPNTVLSLISSSADDDDLEFDFLLKAPLLPRSSSLKSRKTPPPGTPTQRKSVRFADALGLDLELVRHILNPDEPPNVPSSAVQFTRTVEPFNQVISYWRLSFPHPAPNEALTERVLQRKVSLASCTINNSNRRVYGTVRVANVAYEKRVSVRYTLNGWLTFAEVEATYIEHSNDLITDRFSFELRIPENLVARSRLEFSVRFCAGQETHWDNNAGRNYSLECVDYNINE